MRENNTTILRKDTDPSAFAAASGRPPSDLPTSCANTAEHFGAVIATV